MIGFLVQKVKAIAGHGACWNWGWIFCTCKRISWICCRCPSGDDFCTLRHENGLKLRLSTRAPTNSIFQTGIADSFSSFLYDKSRPRTRLDTRTTGTKGPLSSLLYTKVVPVRGWTRLEGRPSSQQEDDWQHASHARPLCKPITLRFTTTTTIPFE